VEVVEEGGGVWRRWMWLEKAEGTDEGERVVGDGKVERGGKVDKGKGGEFEENGRGRRRQSWFQEVNTVEGSKCSWRSKWMQG
jgi:hypothetical protein